MSSVSANASGLPVSLDSARASAAASRSRRRARLSSAAQRPSSGVLCHAEPSAMARLAERTAAATSRASLHATSPSDVPFAGFTSVMLFPGHNTWPSSRLPTRRGSAPAAAAAPARGGASCRSASNHDGLLAFSERCAVASEAAPRTNGGLAIQRICGGGSGVATNGVERLGSGSTGVICGGCSALLKRTWSRSWTRPRASCCSDGCGASPKNSSALPWRIAWRSWSSKPWAVCTNSPICCSPSGKG
mmetsp:Transcript_7765/g.20019  ORF Transcript_7765/g.20019 Transcript_7765/m.20019 type:complete len:247 (+) Transcript_7765:1800-2540(+)